MSAIDELLEAEVERVPVDLAAGRQAVRVRVRARHRRRTAGAAIVLAVVALVGLALMRVGDDPYQPVITGPGPADRSTTTMQTSTTVTAGGGAGSPMMSVSADPDALADGQVVTVSGSGFPPFATSVTLSVCLDAVKLASCDSARPVLVEVDENHGFATSMRLYSEVLDDQWRRCSACVLRMDWRIGGTVQDPVVLPITFVPADAPGAGLRPQLRLDQADHGVTVGVPFTVEATNLQIGQGYTIGVCPSPRSGDDWVLTCDLRQVAYGSTDGEGRLQLTATVRPELASVCPESTPCGLAIDGPYLDDPLLVMVPIDLRSP